MKKLISTLLPLIGKFKGKKPIVIIISVIVIAIGLFAVEKGYIAEDVLKMDLLIDHINGAFETSVVDSVVLPIDSIKVVIVDSIPAE